MRIGLFGGTFDPPHIGHLIVAQDARFGLSLDRLVFIPAAQPPHKRGSISPAPLRLAMLEAAVAGEPGFDIDDVELNRPGASYTVDTLRIYRTRYPADELFLLMGADQFAEIASWREADALPSLATLAVLSRGGAGHDASRRESAGPGPIEVSVTRIDLSATEVRRRVAAGEPIRYLVPSGVEELIRRHGLYTRAPARTGAPAPG